MAAPLVGRRVIVQGITGRAELNGRVGVAESFNHDAGRYVVQLDARADLHEVGHGPKVALRAHNVLPEPAGAANNNDFPPPGAGAGAGAWGNAAGAAAAPQGGVWDPAFTQGVARISALVALVMLWKVLGLKLWVSGLLAFGVYKFAEGGGNVEAFANSVAQAAARATVWVNNRTGQTLSRAQLGVAVLAVAAVLWFLTSDSGEYSHYGHGHHGYGGGGGGGFDLYWLMGAAMLGSFVWRTGGGGRPGGWSLGEFWNGLSNINFFEGMMLMNLIQQVLGGRRRGGMYGGGGFGRRRYY